jgi:hypothetical protein
MEAAIQPRRPDMTATTLRRFEPFRVLPVRDGSVGSQALDRGGRGRLDTALAILVIAALAVVMLAVVVAGMAAAPAHGEDLRVPGPMLQPVVARPAPSRFLQVVPSVPDAPLR